MPSVLLVPTEILGTRSGSKEFVVETQCEKPPLESIQMFSCPCQRVIDSVGKDNLGQSQVTVAKIQCLVIEDYPPLVHERWIELRFYFAHIRFKSFAPLFRRPGIMQAKVFNVYGDKSAFPHGTGADVMKRIAAPMVGGVVTSVLMELAVYPVIYYLWKLHSLKKRGIADREKAGKLMNYFLLC